MKNFPSGVHWPQHSLCEGCQPESKGCRLLPSADACQLELFLVCGSFTVKRKIAPSRVPRRSLAVPAAVKSGPGSLPSPLARKIPFPLLKASRDPSGDHAPEWPSRLPKRRGEPPTTGTLQRAPSREVPCAVFIKSTEPSGDTSKTLAKPVSSNEFGIGNVSPPFTEVCESSD